MPALAPRALTALALAAAALIVLPAAGASAAPNRQVIVLDHVQTPVHVVPMKDASGQDMALRTFVAPATIARSTATWAKKGQPVRVGGTITTVEPTMGSGRDLRQRIINLAFADGTQVTCSGTTLYETANNAFTKDEPAVIPCGMASGAAFGESGELRLVRTGDNYRYTLTLTRMR